MKRYITLLLLLIPVVCWADSKVTELNECTDAQTSDLMYIVDDPSGSATGKKITVTNVFDALTLEEVHLKAVDTAADEECLTYEATVGDFEWQSCGTSLLASGSDGDSSEQDTDSGMELVGGYLTLLRGCDDNDVLKWDETADDWNCEADAGAAGGDSWSDAVDSDIVPTGADDTYDLGSAAAQFKDGYFDGTLEADALTEGGVAVLNNDEMDGSAELIAIVDDETGTGALVFATSPTLVTPTLGTINSGVGTALTALNGENIQNDTIDDDSIDFGDVTCVDITATDCGAVTSTGTITAAVGFDCTGAADCDYGSADILDHTFTEGDSTLIIDGGITVSTGDKIQLGAVQWDDGSDQIDGEQIADNTIDDDSIDFADMTCVDITTTDCGAVTSTGTITAAVGFDITGAADIDIGSADVTDVTIITDGGVDSLTIGNNADLDFGITFDGDTSNGTINYDEDNADFEFDQDIATTGNLSGVTITASTSHVAPLFDAAGNEDLDIGSADVDDITLITDGGTWILDDTLTFPVADVSPNAAGEMIYDNTIAGLSGGGIRWYDNNSVRVIVDLETDPSDDDYVVTYDADADGFYMKVDADSGGATAYDDIGDPDAASSITFNDGETVTWATEEDSAGSFFLIQNSDADLAANTYLLDLDYSVDDDQANADYFKCQDAGGVVFSIQENGNTVSTGTLQGTVITATTSHIGPLLDAAGDEDMDYGSGDVDDHTFLTDGTGTAEIVLPAGAIDGTEILDDTIDSDDYAAASIDNEHLADNAVDSAEINTNAVKLDALDVSDVSDNIAGDIAEGELADSIVVSADIKDDVIVNADINSAAAIAISKTALVAGTNITLSTNTLNVDDAFLANDGDVGTGVYDFGGTTTFEIWNSTSDMALGVAGQIGLQLTDDQLVFHGGAAGEAQGEAALSVLKHVSVTMDPGSWYDSDAEVFLFTVGDDAPEGITIVEWTSSCNVAPDTEINADLRYADAFIGLANAADIDEIDTTSGTSSEDTNGSINGGSAVANGKVVYIGFDADPEGTCVQWSFEMWYYAEED